MATPDNLPETTDRPSPVGPADTCAFQALTPAESSATPALPAIAGYEVLEVLGRGGMGVVYKARHRALDRVVALKMVLAGSHTGPEQRARFSSEAGAVARLQHANIVQIYEVGEADGQPFCALEYIAGGSLAERLAGTPLPPSAAAALLQTLADAMEAAHRKGVVHRDLKPANVLLGPDGVPKITDFGLAKLLGDESSQTQSGSILGTPSYMAPEQAEGRVHAISPATDVYALGAILYECLAGRPPFRAVTMLETLEQVRSQEPLPLSQLQSGVPRDLETICLKCLAKEAARRYRTAHSLARDLGRYLNREPIEARPVSGWERLRLWVKRRPMYAALIVVSFLAVVAFAAGGVFLYLNDRLNAALLEAETQRGRAEAQEARMHRFLYLRDMGQAHRAWEEGNVAKVLALLEQHRPGTPAGEDLRGFEWHYLWRLCHTATLTLKSDKGSYTGVAFSPDGQRLAAGNESGTVTVWDARSGGQLLHFTASSGQAIGVAFSADGTRLAVAAFGDKILVFDAATGEPVLALPWTGPRAHCVAFSPDGRWLAAGSYEDSGEIRIWDARNGKEVLASTGHSGPVFGIAFDRDGGRLAAVGRTARDQQAAAKVWSVETGQPVLDLQGHTGAVRSVAFSPDGKWLATASDDRTLQLWDAASAQAAHRLAGHRDKVLSVAFSPDGGRLVSAGEDRLIKVWDSLLGQELNTLRGHAGPVYRVAFSPDGQRVASTSRDFTLRVWDADQGPDAATLRGHPGNLWGMDFSPDGRQLASCGDGSVLKRWDMVTGREAASLDVTGADDSGRNVLCVAHSPDGRLLAAGTDVGSIHIWDAASGNELRTLEGVRDTRRLMFSADGRRLAASGRGPFVKVWDMGTGLEVVTLQVDPLPVCAFAPDARWLALARREDHQVVVWDAEHGKQARLLGHNEAVTTLAFSADGTRLATGNAGAVTLWNLATGQAAWTRPGLGLFPRCITFSPDGRRLTACSTDRQTVPIWDAADGSEVLTLRGHSGPLQHVAFGPDGQRLFTYSSDRTVRVWDGVTGQEVLTLPLPDPVAMATVPCLAVSRDGKRLAALCKDHTIRVWNAGSPAAAHQHPTLGAYHLPDRRAAEWVLASGGSVDVISGGRTMVGVRDRADLPAANYRYRAISREP